MPRKQSVNVSGGTALAPEGVRPQIRDMIASGTDEDFEKSVPESTASTPGSETTPPRRTRRSKAEMDAARGVTAPASDDLMSDPRYARVVGEMTGMGGKEILSIGFKASGKPLDKDEEKKVDDVFYVMARKGGFNPANSWIALVIYFLAVILQLVISRTDLGAKIAELLKPKPMTPQKEGSPVA